MAVTSSSTIAYGTAATQDELWALRYLFLHNWNDPVVVNTSYATNIAQAVNGVEQRWAQVDRPYRTITSLLTIVGRNKVASFRNAIARMGQAKALVPLFCDQVFLDSPAPFATNNYQTVDNPLLRRFSTGGRAVLVKYTPDGMVSSFLVVTIASGTTSTVLYLDGGTPADWGVGDVVIPLIEAQLSLVEIGDGVVDNGVTWRVTATEVLGNNTLEPSALIGDVVADEFDGKQVFKIPVNWADALSVGASRVGDYTNIGRGFSLQTFGPRSRWTLKMPFTESTRSSSWSLLKFFEAHGGRLKSFYAVSPFTDLVVTAITSTLVTVESIGESIDWDYYTHIAVVQTNGTVTIKEINSVARVSSEDRITVDTFSPTISLTDIERISFAHLMRFDTDSFDEKWITDSVLQNTLSLVECFSEEDVATTDLDVLPASGAETSLSKATEQIYASLLTFGYRGTYARYITFNRNFTDGSANLYLALPNCEIKWAKQTGATKDEPIKIDMPPVLPFSLHLANQPVGLVSVLIEELDVRDEATRRIVFSGTAETLTGNNNGRSDVVQVTVKGLRSCLEVGLGIPASNLCSWGFGDKTCRVSLAAIRVTVTASAISDRTMTISSLANAAPYYTKGYATRGGLSLMIREQTASNTLVFNEPPPSEWVGQSVVLTPGCNKTLDDCVNKWDNEENFGGIGIRIPKYHPIYESP